MRILFIGIGYFPALTSGDKNFFRFLVGNLSDQIEDVAFISVNDYENLLMRQRIGTKEARIYSFTRPFHLNSKKYHPRVVGSRLVYHHMHGTVREVLERQAFLLARLPRICRIVNLHGSQIVHFMDNFGFGMRWVKQRLRGVPVTASACRYNPRQRIYDTYIRRSYAPLDGVVAYTNAYAEKLKQIGVIPEKVRAIKWSSIDTGYSHPDRKAIELTRRTFGLSGKIVLWAGFMQQIQEDSFLASVDIARKVKEAVEDVTFVFCFKPESFREKYRSYASDKIRILTDVPDFKALLASAYLFLSPVTQLSSTVTPPLTWIEAMAMGVPVITNRVLGVDEIIEHGRNGIAVDSIEDLPSALTGFLLQEEKQRHMQYKATKSIKTHYNLDVIGKEYLSFWRGLLR